ncbi:MAG: exopolysaccharide biosynthesis protein [Opitutaceae bacterium]|nr:exopolysaccharide biosynthesis protein [Opitutaceae bacterium]
METDAAPEDGDRRTVDPVSHPEADRGSAVVPPAPSIPRGPLPARKLSEELADLRARFADRPVTLCEVIVVLRGRAYSLIIILLTLPFLTPLPLFGLSTPLGLAIAIIALRLAMAQRPWLPKKLQGKGLPAGFFGRLFTLAERTIRVLESMLRPRLLWLTASGWRQQLHAAVILIAAIELMLPLPIPLTNTLPAWAILLVAGGLLERDGWFIGAGYFLLVASVGYFVFLGETTRRGIEALVQWFGG